MGSWFESHAAPSPDLNPFTVCSMPSQGSCVSDDLLRRVVAPLEQAKSAVSLYLDPGSVILAADTPGRGDNVRL